MNGTLACSDLRENLSVYHAATQVGHYSDVIMGAMASRITSLTIVYSTVCSGADQRKHQSSVSLAFVRGIHRWPVNSPHKWSVTRKYFPFDDVIVYLYVSLTSIDILHTWWMQANNNRARIRKDVYFCEIVYVVLQTVFMSLRNVK